MAVTEEDVEELIIMLRHKATNESTLSFGDLQRAVQKEYAAMLGYAENATAAYRTIEKNPYHPDLWNKFRQALEEKANKKPATVLRHPDYQVVSADWKDVQDKLGRFLAWAWRKDQEIKEEQRELEREIQAM